MATKFNIHFDITCNIITPYILQELYISFSEIYEGWNFNSGNYLFTTDTK